MKNNSLIITLAVMSLLVVALWQFPAFWYVRTDPLLGRIWFSPLTNMSGWAFSPIPVEKTAEAALACDRLISGWYTNASRQEVKVFLAKRYAESQNEIGLFAHTPDRCWTETGWQMEPTTPDCIELKLHGMPIFLERRIFTVGQYRELVYFGGMVGGQSLPYRLDHNLSIGMKFQRRQSLEKTGSAIRAADSRMWQRVWDSFQSRRPLIGPKQFIRISTTITDADLEKADRLLRTFLETWLVSVDYQTEIVQWKQGAVGR